MNISIIFSCVFYFFMSLTHHAYSDHTEKKVALIFGITGQDGTYLAEFLLNKGYEVHGVKRRTSVPNVQRHTYIHRYLSEKEGPQIHWHYGDVTDSANIFDLINHILPDEIYNLAGQSQVEISFETASYTAHANALGTLNILEVIRQNPKKMKFYQASSSEMFGKTIQSPQNEQTPFFPCSPYAIAKLYAHWITINYRQAHGVFACSGILFNHESPLRGENFVTRKITKAVAAIYYGLQDVLYLGNLDAQRDWGYAPDYVEAMWLMLQQETPSDYIIATGQMHSVRELVEIAFKEIGIEMEWQGSGIDEVGKDKLSQKTLVKINPTYFRPLDAHCLVGNPQKAYANLAWKATTNFETLVKIMIESDIQETKKKLRTNDEC